MVRVVNLRDEVGDRQLQTIGNCSKPLVLSNEAEPRPEIKKYVGDVAYDEVAVDEERGSEGSGGFTGHLHQLQHFIRAARLAGNVEVIRAGLLQRKAHEFTATGNAVPVIELVWHERSPSLPAFILVRRRSLFLARSRLSRTPVLRAIFLYRHD